MPTGLFPGSHNFLFWIDLKSKTGQRGLFSEACTLNKSRHFSCHPYRGFSVRLVPMRPVRPR